MKAYIVTTMVGCFGVDENNKIISFKPFPKNPAEIATKLSLASSEVIEEEKQLVEELRKKGYEEFIFSSRKIGAESVEPDNNAEKYVKENLRSISIERKLFKDQSEFNKFLVSITTELAKAKIRKSVGRDKLIIQAVSAIDELDKSINILVERLREFYSLHFPEMDRVVANHEKYAKLIVEFGSRNNIKDQELSTLAKNSVGIEFEEKDIRIAQKLAQSILGLYSLKEDLTRYTEDATKTIAPNISEIAGPMLAARLISKAGSLEKLAKSASSTIQLLGAEKSLFRFLHGKGKSPRFGILATHPLVQNAPEKLKGKVARSIASKLSIAAKIDFYSKEDKSKEMKKELQEKIKEILSSSQA